MTKRLVVSVGHEDIDPVNHQIWLLVRRTPAGASGASNVSTGHRYAPGVPELPPTPDALIAPSGSDSPWTLDVSGSAPEALPLLFHRAHRNLGAGTRINVTVTGGIGRDRLVDLVDGAGWTLLYDPVAAAPEHLEFQVERRHTLADTVGPRMRLLVCGVNPSPYSADVGVGYGRPGNRFWPAVLATGIVAVDRDPMAALAAGMGMTDFAKRATRTAAEVTQDEYEAGFDRVTRLVTWLAPGAVCFVGLSGWRTVVDRHAVAGVQPATVAGRPVYVMPSTSGLNARSTPSDLAHHLTAAWDLSPSPD
jgi:TDG/mug DNA glycosylase family protein